MAIELWMVDQDHDQIRRLELVGGEIDDFGPRHAETSDFRKMRITEPKIGSKMGKAVGDNERRRLSPV